MSDMKPIPGFQEVHTRYLQQLPGRISDIVMYGAQLLGNKISEDEFQKLLVTVHGLKGSGATFGFPEISDLSVVIEEVLLDWGAGSNHEQFAELVKKLKQTVELLVAGGHGEHQVIIRESVTNRRFPGEGKRILIIEDDMDVGEYIALQLNQYGYFVMLEGEYQYMERDLHRFVPDVLMMDIVHQDDYGAGLRAVKELIEKGVALPPVIFASARDDLAAKIDAVKAGCSGYIVKPYEVDALVDRFDALLGVGDRAPYRVLIVDDSVAQSAVYAKILQNAGMETAIVNNPAELPSIMAEFNPELLLMDMYMDEYNGVDLAAVIRQDEYWLSMPIVFLSAETEQEKQILAMQVGADDFLTKPINDRYLVASIGMRAERYRCLRSRMERDSLTGLLDHTHLKESLETELSRAARQGGPVSYVMVDLDHFKKVNDTWGHAAGDMVIRNLARMLNQRLRVTDIVGRYGGEEFGVILPGTNAEMAQKVMDEIRKRFYDLEQHTAEGSFRVTLSCGIASYPAYVTVAEISEAADQALYRAKEKGRNQVVLA